MTTDDMQQNSATPSDDVRPSPTPSDDVRPRPTMSATRSDAHTLTTREVMKIFEEAGIPRAQRSIERYCAEGHLDCMPDAIERRQYITRKSVDILIGQLKEIASRHQKESDPEHGDATGDDTPRHAAPEETVKRGTPEKQGGKHQAGEDGQTLAEMQARIKELEATNFNLEIGKRASEQVVGILRDQITQQVQEFSVQLTQQSRRVGQLETEMRQLMAPARDRRPTRDDSDSDARNVGGPIDAEFIEASSQAQHEPDIVPDNHAPQP
jgi:hypothetical protein